MTEAGERFTNALGRPDPEAGRGPACSDPALRAALEALRDDIGGGWFKNRFLYLFGDELDALKPCLDAWSFLVRGGSSRRTIIGRNAYGAMLVMEDGNDARHVFVLDPFRVAYWSDYGLTLDVLVGEELCEPALLAEFLDDGAYRAWIDQEQVDLEMEDVLGFKAPKALGGTITIGNIEIDGIVDYFEETGAIYAEEFRKLREAPCEIDVLGGEFALNYAQPCEARTDKCDGGEKTGLVHRMPGFETTFACRPCFDEKIRTGAWRIQG
jgi:hypothetical protein